MKAKKVIILENNATGQFRNVLKLYADYEISTENCYLRYSGKPFSVEEVSEILQNIQNEKYEKKEED